MTWRSLLPTGLVAAALGGLLAWKGCTAQKQIVAEEHQVTAADDALIQARKQLESEHTQRAEDQARANMATAEEQAIDDVTRIEGDGDLLDYLNSVAGAVLGE